MYLTLCISEFFLRVFDFFRVEGYAFKHLRVCKFLAVSNPKWQKKGCTIVDCEESCGDGIHFQSYQCQNSVAFVFP
jgi:hypothetical protein